MAEKLNTNNEEKYRVYRQMISSFYQEEQKEEKIKLKSFGNIKLEPVVAYNKFNKEIKVEFTIGINQMYKIKNIPEFYDHMVNNDNVRYGLKLEFIHSREAFDPASLPMLDFIMKYGEIIKYANESTEKYYINPLSNSYIILSNSGIDDFFETVKGKKVEFGNIEITKTEFVDKEPEIYFDVKNKSIEDYIM